MVWLAERRQSAGKVLAAPVSLTATANIPSWLIAGMILFTVSSECY